MAELIVTRTFHPIGQGAFYSEHFELGGKDILMVYDCGATNSVNPPNALCKEVKDSFHQCRYDSKGRLIVDILFLSHFHNDHLNGVSLLAPQKVVCPLVSDDDILMLQVFNEFQSEWNIAAMSNPAILFSNNPDIVQIAPMQSNEIFEGGTFMSLDESHRQIKSGTQIGIPSDQIDFKDLWCFIPYNYHYRWRLEEFKEKLMAADLSYDDLKKDPSSFIKENRKTLRDIFNSFSGNTNEQSLLLYSGPTASDIGVEYLGNDHAYNLLNSKVFNRRDKYLYRHIFIDVYYPWIHEECIRLLNPFGERSTRAATIYYGDITLSEQLISSLTRGLSTHMENVGTIQLPHHGSDRSFHESVLHYFKPYRKEDYEPYSVLFIMCAGAKNKTHPGKNVMATLSHTHQLCIVVKEQRTSSITEKWLLHRI